MQRIVVFQQNGSGEEKIKGIRKHGKDIRITRVVSIDQALPPFVENPEEYLPDDLEADLVLDFLKHPDLSNQLAALCRERDIPLVSTGKKIRAEGVFSPPT